MNSRKMLDLLRGYSIFFLCLFIFAMWGINLLSISQTEKKVLIYEDGGSDLVEEPAVTSFYIKPLPLLYYYFLELGYKIEFVRGAPARNRLLVVVDPPSGIDQATLRELFGWVRTGGNLLFLLPDDHELDRFVGITRDLHEKELPADLMLRLPYLDEIETLSTGRKGVHRRLGMSFFSVMPEPMGGSNILMSFRGSGRLMVIAHPDFLTGAGLKRHDNLTLVTRVVEHMADGNNLSIFDAFPGGHIRAHGRRLVRNSRNFEARQKFDHLSFWSLLKANPVSWVLLQMLVALTVYFISTGRRFGRPVVLVDQGERNTSYVRSLGRLLAEGGNSCYVLSEILYGFAAAAIKRYGLDQMAPLREIIAAIRGGNVEVADRLSRIERDIDEIMNRRNDSPELLLRVVRTLEWARKELKLHD